MRTFLAVVLFLACAAVPGAEGKANPVVVVETSLGSFEVELYQDKTPETVKNFLSYVDEKFYDGTIFHRVINNFMIQGGGFTEAREQKKTHAPVKNESGNGPKNVEYAIAMARTSDPDSATSQFYINVKNNDFLDANQYCAFGMVTSGKDVVDKIKAVQVFGRGPNKLSEAEPVTPVVIKSIRLKT